MIKSKINNHLHAERPPFPFMPLYRPAWRYPENMEPRMDETTKRAERLPISLFRYHEPKTYRSPGHAELSKNPMKNCSKIVSYHIQEILSCLLTLSA